MRLLAAKDAQAIAGTRGIAGRRTGQLGREDDAPEG